MLFCCEAKTQTNLVPNGSFEEYDVCPTTFFELNGYCKNWFDPTNCSTDYFHSCSFNVGTPSNALGFQFPHDGNAYLGLYTFYKGINSYRETVCTKLIETLIKNKKYCITMYISLADSMCYSVNNLDVSFSYNIYPNAVCDFNPLNLQSSISFNLPSYFQNKSDWIKLESSFIANGTENYIYISNLRSSNDTIKLSNCQTADANFLGAYYYIDDITLKACEDLDFGLFPNIFTPNNDGVNDSWEVSFNENVICVIYNRWGNKILETDKKTVKWDGYTTSGIECSEGTYYYSIQTKKEKYKGFIQLIR
jgi:OOP family OmpA-OmpF porin